MVIRLTDLLRRSEKLSSRRVGAVKRIAINSYIMPGEGLEPSRPLRTQDFKS